MRGRPTQSIAPVVVVWKASKHGRSKPKMKIFKTKHVDDIIGSKKVHGIPESAIYLDVGVGTGCIILSILKEKTNIFTFPKHLVSNFHFFVGEKAKNK